MSDLKKYFAFSEAHPALFLNPPECSYEILLDQDMIHEAESEVEKRLQAYSLPSEWAEVGIIYQDQYICILHDVVLLPNKSIDIYVRYIGDEDGKPGAVVLPVYQEHIILVRHFRHASRTWHLEIPGGFGVKGVSNEEIARRELTEEIEAIILRLIPLGKAYLDISSSPDYVEIFYAEIESYGDIETHEGISELLLVSISDFEQMICRNEINHTATIVAFARAKLLGLL